jgi:hypothetical protein
LAAAVLLETTTFRLAAGVDEDAFLAADEALQEELSPSPGFVRRTTARGDAGEWLVLSMWGTAADADAAPTPVPARLVDPASVRTARWSTLG